MSVRPAHDVVRLEVAAYAAELASHAGKLRAADRLEAIIRHELELGRIEGGNGNSLSQSGAFGDGAGLCLSLILAEPSWLQSSVDPLTRFIVVSQLGSNKSELPSG